MGLAEHATGTVLRSEQQHRAATCRLVSVTANTHTPVLLAPVLAGLAVQPDGFYVDATYGRGGHSSAILQGLNDSGRLLVMDRDPAAIAAAEQRFAGDQRVAVVEGSFTLLKQAVENARMMGQVQGVLLDLGVSSPQLEDPARGFSFMHDGPLDMRMDTSVGPSVAAWLANAQETAISRVLRDFGEERHARRIARAICQARATAAIERTGQLARIISEAIPKRFHEPGRHPATKSFQALRIFINGELDELRAVLPQLLDVLAPGGRLAIISFHSLEDRIVKRFLREQSRGDPYPVELPVPASALNPALKLIGRAQHAEADETEYNPRARSAVLRVAERCAA